MVAANCSLAGCFIGGLTGPACCGNAMRGAWTIYESNPTTSGET
jgi:hypothetical protein